MKALVIYFSRTDENYFGGQMRYISKGNTEVIAEYIRDLCGADMFKVERKIPYAKDYMTCIKESKAEKDNDERPELSHYLDNVDAYDAIFIGAPVYWETMPMPLFTALERLDFHGKTIMPFVTHEGSGLANIVEDIKKLAPGANVKHGLAVLGSAVGSAKSIVETWVRQCLESQ